MLDGTPALIQKRNPAFLRGGEYSATLSGETTGLDNYPISGTLWENMVTKRQLGIFLSAIAVLVLLWTGVTDRIGMGEWGGFGPLQQIGLGGALLLLIVGLILIRIGNRPV